MRASSMSFGRRMGTFSLTIGMFLILYFVFSASVETPSVIYLLGGFGLIGLGILAAGYASAPASNRHRALSRSCTAKKARKKA
jgi:hypothetical protein